MKENEMKPDICIFHMPCADGFTAAWAIWRKWPDIEFVDGVYGQPAPDVKGKHVLIVDFSYKFPVLAALGLEAASITILDHHKSAEADLMPFSVEELVSIERLTDGEYCAQHTGLPVQALFDMTKSGAMLAWEYAHPDVPAPTIVHAVQDRDLWKFELHGTREIAATLFSHPYDFEVWDDLAQTMQSPTGLAHMIAQGEAIERKHHKDIAELLAITTRSMVISGYTVPVANLPYTMSSDAANALAKHNRFGACYYDNAEGKRVFSLRSTDDGIDVSEVAVMYGGGGHKRAAGFTAPKGWEGDV